MSDQPLSDDELASAMLDGEATAPRPGDAAVAARVDELRRAADAIAQPLVVDDAPRERAIAAALQAFDDAPPATATEPDTTAARRTRFMPALAAVAAAVLVLVGVVAVLRHDSSTPADTASGAEAASGAATVPTTMAGLAPARGATNDAASQGGAAPAAVPVTSARDLGNLSDPAALQAAIGPEAFMTKAAQLAPTPTACEPEARAGAATDLGTLTDDVTLHWKGRAARALVFVDAASASHIVVVADPSCAVLDLIV
jgi:hypothetical protein